MTNLKLALALTAALAATPAVADDAATVERWYTALGKADGAALAELLAPNAIVKLDDLAVSQTKAEFVASMEEWKARIDGGSIRHKPDAPVEGGLAYKVCYDLADYDLLAREVFTFDNGLVLESQQRSIAESCEAF